MRAIVIMCNDCPRAVIVDDDDTAEQRADAVVERLRREEKLRQAASDYSCTPRHWHASGFTPRFTPCQEDDDDLAEALGK